MVPPRLKVEILVSWPWVKRCVFAGIKKLGWYSGGRVRVSLVSNRFSQEKEKESWRSLASRVKLYRDLILTLWQVPLQPLLTTRKGKVFVLCWDIC